MVGRFPDALCFHSERRKICECDLEDGSVKNAGRLCAVERAIGCGETGDASTKVKEEMSASVSLFGLGSPIKDDPHIPQNLWPSVFGSPHSVSKRIQ